MLDGVGNLAPIPGTHRTCRRAPKLILGEALYVARDMLLPRFGIVHMRISDPTSAAMRVSEPNVEGDTTYLTPSTQEGEDSRPTCSSPKSTCLS